MRTDSPVLIYALINQNKAHDEYSDNVGTVIS